MARVQAGRHASEFAPNAITSDAHHQDGVDDTPNNRPVTAPGRDAIPQSTPFDEGLIHCTDELLDVLDILRRKSRGLSRRTAKSHVVDVFRNDQHDDTNGEGYRTKDRAHSKQEDTGKGYEQPEGPLCGRHPP